MDTYGPTAAATSTASNMSSSAAGPAAALATPGTTSTMSSSSGSSLPPIHAFPPFYTLQPNPNTRATQLDLWTELVLGYAQRARLFSLDADGEWERNGELFYNRAIDRRLSPLAIRTLLAHMVSKGAAGYDAPFSNGSTSGRSRLVSALASSSGMSSTSAIEADPASLPSRAWVYWRKPDEWAELIYKWVSDTGQNRSIITLYELTEGELSEGQEFRELPRPLLRIVLDVLVKQGKAQIFGGAKDQDGEGVKFA